MNKVDFTFTGGFPFTQDTLSFMQNAYNQGLGAIAGILGDKVIISGCNDNNGIISPGIVALNGEILYTPGGSAATVYVDETAQNALFEDGTSKPVYISRTLEFGIGTPPVNWLDFVRLSSIKNLMGMIMPSGAIIMWGGQANTIPAGWRICDGTNGAPDLRGRFIVGCGKNPNPAPGDPNPTYSVGHIGGKTLHTLTGVEMPKHSHFSKATSGNAGNTSNYYHTSNKADAKDRTLVSKDGVTEPFSTGGMVGWSGDNQPHENRPPYYALVFIQKI